MDKDTRKRLQEKGNKLREKWAKLRQGKKSYTLEEFLRLIKR